MQSDIYFIVRFIKKTFGLLTIIVPIRRDILVDGSVGHNKQPRLLQIHEKGTV